jgi:hypothetical protein
MLGRLKSLFQPKAKFSDPYEQFVVEFLEECIQQRRRPASYDQQDRSFVFDDPQKGQLTVFLDNCFRIWLERDAKGKADHLVRFVRAMADSKQETGTDELQTGLKPGIRARSLIGEMLIRSWSGSKAQDSTNEIAWSPLCGDIASILLFDRTDTMKPLWRSDLDRAGLTFEHAMAIAMANLRADVPAPVFEVHPQADGLFYSSNLEDYQSALLLLSPGKDFEFPQLDGDPIALLPSRNKFFVTGSRNLPGLGKLFDIAEAAREEEANFCSARLLIWRSGQWDNFAVDAGSSEAGRQRLLEVRETAIDYLDQKNLLDQLYQAKKKEVFVSPVEVFQEDDQPGSAFSITFLPSGRRDTLLPVADRISLIDQIVDPRTGIAQTEPRDRIVVAWSDVMAVASGLFEAVPQLYPPRYRVLGFPDATTWQKLKAKALN